MGWQRVRHDWVTKHTHTHTHTHTYIYSHMRVYIYNVEKNLCICAHTHTQAVSSPKKKKRRRRSIISGKHSYTEDMYFWPLHLIWLLSLPSSLKSVSAWIYYVNIAFLESCSIHQNYSSPFTQNIWEEYSKNCPGCNRGGSREWGSSVRWENWFLMYFSVFHHFLEHSLETP